ncbi:hypothetical protein [uncultured Gimesia sp.]|uniref:hypothetical protein n=1 Tax=uncultured Gimesia sp. TaxID=1678688 RepID=UPI0030DB65AA
MSQNKMECDSDHCKQSSKKRDETRRFSKVLEWSGEDLFSNLGQSLARDAGDGSSLTAQACQAVSCSLETCLERGGKSIL